VLHQVAVGRVDLGQSGRGGVDELEDGDRIEAPYLQLVLERLWEVETEQGSRRLRLETLEGLGGAAHIVEDHLERAMAELSPEEKDAAAAMYNHLVTPSGTKIAHRAGDLAATPRSTRPRRAVLNRLVEERIVRAGKDGAEGPRYEIFHDVLAEAVLAWRTRHEAERRIEAERHAAARRHRRLLALAIGALVLIAILAAIAVYALVQRGDARDQARRARGERLRLAPSSPLQFDPEAGGEARVAGGPPRPLPCGRQRPPKHAPRPAGESGSAWRRPCHGRRFHPRRKASRCRRRRRKGPDLPRGRRQTDQDAAARIPAIGCGLQPRWLRGSHRRRGRTARDLAGQTGALLYRCVTAGR